MKINLLFLDKKLNEIKRISLQKEDFFNKRGRLKSILDISIENNIDLKYGCMGGSCSACICEVLEGFEYLNHEALHNIVYKGLKENQILTCITSINFEKINNNPEKDIFIKIKLLL